MAGKPRVHELAKELGVESKTVLAKLKEMGEFVKSASSTIEAPVARRLRATMEADGSPVASPRGASPRRRQRSPLREPGRLRRRRHRRGRHPCRLRRCRCPSPRVRTTSRWPPPRRGRPQLKAEQDAAVRAAQERGPAAPRPAAPQADSDHGSQWHERHRCATSGHAGRASPRRRRPRRATARRGPVATTRSALPRAVRVRVARRPAEPDRRSSAEPGVDAAAAEPGVIGRPTAQPIPDADPASGTPG